LSESNDLLRRNKDFFNSIGGEPPFAAQQTNDRMRNEAKNVDNLKHSIP
jgi:hypothetical protein